MAWTTPGTVSAGEVLTAARYNQDTVSNAFMGRAVYTNEAARDAAITAPEEGMLCYLTAPTIPAATGATTFLPSGIETVYNGSVWVCRTPVSAFTDSNGTRALTNYGTLTGGGTNPSVTLVTGTTALIRLRADTYNDTLNGYVLVSVAVSGAGTVAASDAYSLTIKNSVAVFQIATGTQYVLGGLTAGTNTFTLNYRVNAGTGNFNNRGITVQGIA
jgi:hypothetical protein